MFNKAEFEKRRKQLLSMIGSEEAVVLSAAPIAIRTGEAEYPYRQQNDFYYLSGFKEPEAVLLLLPDRAEGEYVLFNRTRDREREIWDGYRAGQQGAEEIYGADQAFPISELHERLSELLIGRESIHTVIGIYPDFEARLLRCIHELKNKVRTGITTPLKLIDITPTIHELRLVKSDYEIGLMRKAAEISAQAHIRAMRACKPGMFEYQLQAEVEYEFQRNGAYQPAYSSIVGCGGNSCILHYIQNDKRIADGDIVLIDAGCEYEYYASDITRTFPANGHFSAEQAAVYDLVLAAQLAGIATIKPGIPWDAVQEAILNVLVPGLIDLGILQGNARNLIQERGYFAYYMHRSGHWLGLDTHDVGRYKVNHQWRKLEPGMVLTVEPGLYIAANSETDKRFWNIGVRIEDDVLVTANGHEVLSKDAPKKREEIESLIKGGT